MHSKSFQVIAISTTSQAVRQAALMKVYGLLLQLAERRRMKTDSALYAPIETAAHAPEGSAK